MQKKSGRDRSSTKHEPADSVPARQENPRMRHDCQMLCIVRFYLSICIPLNISIYKECTVLNHVKRTSPFVQIRSSNRKQGLLGYCSTRFLKIFATVRFFWRWDLISRSPLRVRDSNLEKCLKICSSEASTILLKFFDTNAS